ncbi:MAG: corrinoid protein [Candidatus Bathyarchaeia archaeon]|jgi:5-methyltetrahydrofolate--homocysteine methyltransferase
MASKEEIFERLRDTVVALDVDNVQRIVKDALDAGISPEDLVSDGLRRGLQVVGEKYQAGDFFLAELIMAGEVMKEAMTLVEPYFKGSGMEPIGRIAIGTVAGDIHDIGKNIVIALLKAAGFEVTDLGVDVPVSRFVEQAREELSGCGRCILGMSALLSVTTPEMENVIKELRKAQIRGTAKVIIGGALITAEFGESIGADFASKDAVEGVKICKRWASSG